MQLFHPPRHGTLSSADRALADEKAALQTEFDLAVLLINDGADNEQTI